MVRYPGPIGCSDTPDDPGEAALIEGLRVEAWQRELEVGDHFCIVPNQAPVTYGTVLPPLDDEQPEPDLRRVRLYNALTPKGVDQVMHIKYTDLPLTKHRFVLARDAGWPTAASVWRVVLGWGGLAHA